MVWVAVEHFVEEVHGSSSFTETKLRLRLQEKGVRLLSELKIVIKQKHRWKRSREVINFRRLLFQPPGVCQQFAEESLGLRPLAKSLLRKRRIISHLTKSSNAHL